MDDEQPPGAEPELYQPNPSVEDLGRMPKVGDILTIYTYPQKDMEDFTPTPGKPGKWEVVGVDPDPMDRSQHTVRIRPLTPP